MRYVFGPLLQKELDQYVTEWNHHAIRHSNMAEVPHGVPSVLYNYPSINGGFTHDFVQCIYNNTKLIIIMFQGQKTISIMLMINFSVKLKIYIKKR